jgi:hypothetical protein
MDENILKRLFQLYSIKKDNINYTFSDFVKTFPADRREDGALYPFVLKKYFNYTHPEYLKEFSKVTRADLENPSLDLLQYENTLVPIHILSWRLLHWVPENIVKEQYNELISRYSELKRIPLDQLKLLPKPMSIAHTLAFNFVNYTPKDSTSNTYYKTLFTNVL